LYDFILNIYIKCKLFYVVRFRTEKIWPTKDSDVSMETVHGLELLQSMRWGCIKSGYIIWLRNWSSYTLNEIWCLGQSCLLEKFFLTFFIIPQWSTGSWPSARNNVA